jgi:hypothetical protein
MNVSGHAHTSSPLVIAMVVFVVCIAALALWYGLTR